MLYRLVPFLAGGSLCLAASAARSGAKIEFSAAHGNKDGGTEFKDQDFMPPFPKVSSITLRGDKRLDHIAFTTSGVSLPHGSEGGNESVLPINTEDYIKSIKVCWDKYDRSDRIFFAQVNTNKGQSITAGRETPNCATETKDGYAIVGAYGRAGRGIDQLGFVYASL